MDWVFVMWITIGSGSQSTQKMTELQCKAAIAELDKTIDPIMAYCWGPKGQSIRTSDIRDRMARRLPLNPKGGPVAGKAADGI